jgi:integrase/recombinase XerC
MTSDTGGEGHDDPSPEWDLPGFSAWLSGRSEATRRAYVGDLTAFARWMNRSDITGPSRVDRLHLRRYLASLGTRRLARATMARKAAALRCYFGWALRGGRVEADPARSLRAPSGKGRLPRVLSAGEIDTLLGGEATSALDQRDVAALELLYAAGLRVSELCGLDRRGVDLRGRTVTVLGKGGKERRVPMHERAAAALDEWLRDGRTQMPGPPEAVFVNQRGARLGPRDVRRILDRRAGAPPPPPPRPPTPTRSATASPPTCSTGAPICGSSRNFSGTPAWPPRRSTRT